MFPGRFKFGRIEQVNRDEAHLLAGGAEVVQFDVFVAPAADAVVDVALELGGWRGFGARRFGQQRRRGGGKRGGLDEFSAGHGENFATAGEKIKALQFFKQTGEIKSAEVRTNPA